jgi:hypothetical protein
MQKWVFYTEKSLNRIQKLFFEIGRYGVQQIRNFTLGLFIFVSSSGQKLQPKKLLEKSNF